MVTSSKEEQHRRCGVSGLDSAGGSVWYRTWALRMRGESLEGEALRLNHPGIDLKRRGRQGLTMTVMSGMLSQGN